MQQYRRIDLMDYNNEVMNQCFDIQVLRNGNEITNKVDVRMNFTRAALKGLAVNSLRLSEYFQDGEHIQIDPLGYSYANQKNGFFSH